jgi:membrane protease YdiL (CAAX protease family)
MTESSMPPRPLLNRLFLTPEERRLRAGWRLTLQFIWMAALLGIFGLPLELLTRLRPGRLLQATLFIASIIAFLAITVSVYLARRTLDHRSFASLGLQRDARGWRDLFFGFGLSGLLMGLVFLVEWTAGWLRFDGFAWQTQSWSWVLEGFLGSAIVFILVGWYEELYFRGYLLQNLSDGLNLALGVSLSAAIFALSHSANPNLTWEALVGLFASGLFLAYGYLRTHQLWLPIGLHIGWNFFEGTIFGFQVSGLGYFRLIEQTSRGPSLTTGGAFGPEAGLIMLPAILLGAALIYLYTRNQKLTTATLTPT